MIMSVKTYLQHLINWQRIKSFLLINLAGVLILALTDVVTNINNFHADVILTIIATAILKQVITALSNYLSSKEDITVPTDQTTIITPDTTPK